MKRCSKIQVLLSAALCVLGLTAAAQNQLLMLKGSSGRWRMRASLVWLAVFLAGIGGAARAQPYAYVTNYNTGALSVIDTATDTVVDRVPDVGNGHIVLHPDGTTAFITDRGSNTIAVMDVATRQVVDRLPVGAFPWALAVTPEGDRAYVVRLNVPQSLVFLEVAERRVMTSAGYDYFHRNRP